jgi:hypothetical protein
MQRPSILLLHAGRPRRRRLRLRSTVDLHELERSRVVSSEHGRNPVKQAMRRQISSVCRLVYANEVAWMLGSSRWRRSMSQWGWRHGKLAAEGRGASPRRRSAAWASYGYLETGGFTDSWRWRAFCSNFLCLTKCASLYTPISLIFLNFLFFSLALVQIFYRDKRFRIWCLYIKGFLNKIFRVYG